MLQHIDHVGIACRSLEAAIEKYTSVFGLSVTSLEVNEEQGVKEAMLSLRPGSAEGLAGPFGSYVQLLEPLSCSSDGGLVLVLLWFAETPP